MSENKYKHDPEILKPKVCIVHLIYIGNEPKKPGISYQMVMVNLTCGILLEYFFDDSVLV
jgi:hypothetical protein